MDEIWPVSTVDAASVAGAKERQFAALYTELKRLAEAQLKSSTAASLSASTLLHETYLVLAEGNASFSDRGKFMAYAARVMRNLIIDFSRERRALKRGAGFHITQFNTQIEETAPAPDSGDPQLLQLSAALDTLAVQDARLAEVVDLKYFCGFSFAEIAALRGTSERTIQRDWEKARMLLYGQLQESIDP